MEQVLLIDNYDSFTYNLYHYLEELTNGEITVMRNDEIDFDKAAQFENMVISPGPALPKDAGQLLHFLQQFASSKKILGICLGQQAIAEHFGMKLKNLKEVVHGQSRMIEVIEPNDVLFKHLPKQFRVGRYHSWVIDPETVSDDFLVTSMDTDQNIMSISHKVLPITAVQFHPESVLTEYGKELLKNWLSSLNKVQG